MQVQTRSRGICLGILYFGAREGWVANAIPFRFTFGKMSWYPLYRWLGGLQEQSGRMWKRENFLPCPEFNPRIVQIRSHYNIYAIPAPSQQILHFYIDIFFCVKHQTFTFLARCFFNKSYEDKFWIRVFYLKNKHQN